MKTLFYDLLIGWWLDIPPTMIEQRRAAWTTTEDTTAA